MANKNTYKQTMQIVLLFLLLLLSGCSVATKTENVATRCYERCQYKQEIETIEVVKIERNYEAEKIDNYLASKGSPMTGLGELCVSLEQQTGVPCSLVLAISGIESGFCKAQLGNNCFGWGGVYFDSFADGMTTVFWGLKNNYFDYGLTNPYSIGPKYCPPNRTWEDKVQYFINEIG